MRINFIAYFLVMLCSVAQGQVTLDSQHRVVFVRGGFQPQTETFVTAPDFDPFTASVGPSWPVFDPPGTQVGQLTGIASMSSTLGPTEWHMEAEAVADGFYGAAPPGLFNGVQSSFDHRVRFSVVSTQEFRLFGTFSAESWDYYAPGYWGRYEIYLRQIGNSNSVFQRISDLARAGDASQRPGPFDVVGFLAAGQYEMRITISEATGNTNLSTHFAGSAMADVTFQLPAPGITALLAPPLILFMRRNRA